MALLAWIGHARAAALRTWLATLELRSRLRRLLCVAFGHVEARALRRWEEVAAESAVAWDILCAAVARWQHGALVASLRVWAAESALSASSKTR